MQPVHNLSIRNSHPHFYKMGQIVFRTVKELVKIIAASVFLNFFVKQFINKIPQKREVYLITILLPLIEECLFRGIILHSIYLTQKIYCYIFQSESTEDVKFQKIVRVQLSAIAFALAHLTNSHQNITSHLMQVSWSYLGGVIYANLTEKFQTISLPFLAHGMNNSIIMGSTILPQSMLPLVLVALIVNRIFFFLLATTNLFEKLTFKIQQTITKEINNNYF